MFGILRNRDDSVNGNFVAERPVGVCAFCSFYTPLFD